MKNNLIGRNVGVVGLGYVGLPLAISFGKKLNTLGFDISEKKILNYKNNIDPNNEISQDEFLKSKFLKFSNEPKKFK